MILKEHTWSGAEIFTAYQFQTAPSKSEAMATIYFQWLEIMLPAHFITL